MLVNSSISSFPIPIITESSNNTTKTFDEKETTNVGGLGVITAGIFIIGEICGAGAVSFPQALSKSGIYGKYIANLILIFKYTATSIL